MSDNDMITAVVRGIAEKERCSVGVLSYTTFPLNDCVEVDHRSLASKITPQHISRSKSGTQIEVRYFSIHIISQSF